MDPEQVDPKRIVSEGYDHIAPQHDRWARQVRQEERAKYTAVLLEQVPIGADVLELGCGAGVPTTRQLARRFAVTGVDISARQLELARQNVPTAQFIQADMTELDLEPDSFDAVAAFYSLIHVPRQEQAAFLQKIASWLRPSGLLVATMGTHATPAGYEEDWLGAPMYWSSFDSQTNRALVEAAGLNIIQAEEETAEEFGQPVTFLWIVAQKRGTGIEYRE
jgi:ubiquinone/menaquinone biosynthesis C-methylase UbiE